MLSKKRQREIDAVLCEIDRHVLPEIGKLQRGTGGIGKLLPLGIAIAAQIQHQVPHRIRRIAAVAEHIVPILIAGDALILLEGLNQAIERLDGNLKFLDGGRSATKTGWVASPRYMASSSLRHQASRRRLSANRPFRRPDRRPSGRTNRRCRNPDADASAAGS